MFNTLTKKTLLFILAFGYSGIIIPIMSYENLVGQSPDFSLLVYLFGLVLGFAAMLAAITLDDRTPNEGVTGVLGRPGIAVLAAILLILVVTAVCVGNFLAGYMPEKTGFSGIAYCAGLLLGFAAVAVLYYLPKYLPQMEKPSED
ncbi:MAG: hypothetical protein O0X96_04725 [Methanocorpusculum sp.]|nr:hypothetical protein [Methanocorpusculum sp.]